MGWFGDKWREFESGVMQISKAKNVKDVYKGLEKTHNATSIGSIIHDEIIESYEPTHLAMKAAGLDKKLGKSGQNVNMIDGVTWAVGLGEKTKQANLAKAAANRGERPIEMPTEPSAEAIAQAEQNAQNQTAEASIMGIGIPKGKEKIFVAAVTALLGLMFIASFIFKKK